MLKRKSRLSLLVLLVIALIACNIPSGLTPTSDLSLTLTAQAILLGSGTPTITASATVTPLFTSTTGFTFTPSVPMVSVSTNTNCRTGPSTQYDLIDGLFVGQSAQLVGKSTSTGYWIIQRLNGSGTCWLWGQYAIVSGNTASLPEYPVPPTPTPTKTPTPTNTPTITLTPTSTLTPTVTP